jgi:hypothetical protein
MKWARWILVLCGLCAFAGVTAVDHFGNSAFWIGMSLAVGLWHVMLAVRCPNCRTHVGARKGVFDFPGDDCVTCGRDRKDVWPFQYLIKPD